MIRNVLTLMAFAPILFAQPQTLTLEPSTSWRQVPLAGYVEAARDSLLITNRMAEVIALPVQPGSNVRQGTVLIRLQDKALQQQKAALTQAETAQKASLEQAELQAARMQRLLEKGAVAGVQAEQAQLQVKAIKAELGNLAAQRRQLEEMASYLEIAAKSDGQLTDLNVALGDIAQPGQPLGRFVGGDVRALKVVVPEHLYQEVALARWEVQSASGDTWESVSLVAEVPIADAGTSQHHVYLSIPPGLRPNQRIQVRLLLPSEGLFIPEKAILRRGNLFYVQVQSEQGIQKRLIRVGLPLPEGLRQVQAGLKAGEILVLPEGYHD